jgi:glycosyltransferase involved in cell wall biosynthesis
MNESPLVTVLLSTYNGANFLPAQLDSILGQSYPNVVVRVRDDGSSDETCAILRAYEQSHASISVDYGKNVGLVSSFLALLAAADSTSEFFAFCDQDDVWLRTKVETAVAALADQPSDQPLLYCSAVEHVDADLNHLGYSRAGRLGFGNALVEGTAVYGNTVVMNRKTREIVLEKPPRTALAHDHWLYLVVVALGKVIYDPQPSLKHRLHGANACGWHHGFRYSVLEGLTNLMKPYRISPTVSDQAREFLACHGKALDKQRRDVLVGFLASRRSLLSRAVYAARMKVWRQERLENLKLRAQILVGRY